jgi:anti-sigma-K factor RskA
MSETNPSANYSRDDDQELEDSIRLMRRAHSWRLIGVVAALVATLALAIAYASLSYSDRNEASPAQRF